MKKIWPLLLLLMATPAWAQIATNNQGTGYNFYGGVTIGTSYNAISAPTNGEIIQGNVGIGTNNPASLFTVGSNALQVNSSGTVTSGTWNGSAISTVYGGSGQTGQTTNGDSAYNIPATSNSVATTTVLTAARTWTLPAANALSAGQTICVQDKAGAVSSTYNLTIARAGSDLINGLTSYVLSSQYQSVCLISDGSSVWQAANTSGLAAPTAVAQKVAVLADTYNCTPQNLQWARKSLANVKSGTANATWFVMGDSTGYGEYSNAGTDVGNLVANSWPTQLANYLNGRGINANSNSFAGGSANVKRDTTDPRLTFGTGWAVNGGVSIGGGFLEQTAQNTGAILSFLPTTNVDTFKVLYLTDASAGTFSLDINGTGSANTNANGASGAAITTITKTIGANTLNIKYVSGASKNIYIQGILAYNSQQPSVNIINAGWGGSTTANWLINSPAYEPFPLIPVFNQEVTIIDLGINECNSSGPASTFKTNMQSLITQALTANSGNTNVILQMMNPVSGSCTAALQQAYATALYQLAASNNVCLIDKLARWQSYTNANTLGFMGNTLHPNQLGYADIAQSLINTIGVP